MSDFFGTSEDEVIERLESGSTLAQIAASCGKNRSMLTRWLQADTQRSARSVRARQLGAAAHEERADDEIRGAQDAFELAKAKELAHHYRWRASKLSPREYGDKLDLTVENKGTAKELTDDELVRIATGSSYRTAGEALGADQPGKLH